ncbi:MAG: hypothetical protein ACPHL6_03945, partial [Rubripirellula sp.]
MSGTRFDDTKPKPNVIATNRLGDLDVTRAIAGCIAVNHGRPIATPPPRNTLRRSSDREPMNRPTFSWELLSIGNATGCLTNLLFIVFANH